MKNKELGDKLLLFALLLALFVMAVSCGTKKKITNRSKTEIVSTVNESSVETSDTTLEIDSLAVESSETITLKENEFVEVEADQDTVSIEKEGNKLTITGASKITIGKERESTKSNDTSATQTKRVENTKTQKEAAKESETEIENSSRETDVDVKRWPVWLWLIPLLLVLGVIAWKFRKRII